jgi:hypothetical protein
LRHYGRKLPPVCNLAGSSHTKTLNRGMGLGVFGIAMMMGAAGFYPAPLPVRSQAATFTNLTPENLQSFVRTCQPADTPLCQILNSNTGWDRWMGEAAVMGPLKSYAPRRRSGPTHSWC